MSILSGIVLFAVIWFLTLLVVLPLNLTTQGDRDETLEGTHASAPAELNFKRKLLATSFWATIVWAIVAAVILSGWITVQDLDFWGRMNP